MPLIIYGIGEFAKLLHYYITNESSYELVAFTADKEFIDEVEICGLPVIDFEEINKIFPPEKYQMLVAIGYSNMRNRKILFDKAKAKQYRLINYIHSSIDIKNMSVGENNIIFPGSIVEPFVSIGNNNIIWSMTLLGHHMSLGDHNYISAQCLLAGHVIIKNLCFIGNGVNMIDSLIIENETYIVAGSNIRKNTIENAMYNGNPAKLLKFHKKHGILIK